MEKQFGVSLLELIIVLLIISIIAVIAIPQFTASAQLNQVNTGASLVASMLSEAKTTAIKRNQAATFILDENNSLVWIEVNSNVIGAVRQLPKNTNIKISPNTSAVQERIRFNSSGAITTQPATVSVYNSLKRVEKKVSINLAGRISVEDMNSY